MSNYHVLAGTGDGNSLTVATHISVPNTNNNAGVNYRAAIQEWRPDTTSVVPFIMPAEQTQLDNGELYEYLYLFHTHPGEGLANKRDRMDAQFTALEAAVQAHLQYRLSYWGYSRDVS